MKRMLCFLSVLILLTVSLSGCLAADKKLYSVYILPDSSGPQVLKEDAPSVDQITASTSDKKTDPPAESREVVHDDHLHEIFLNHQLTGQWNVYTSSDNAVTCWFDPETGKLRMISAENWLQAQDQKTMDADEYIEWIKLHVSEYYSENWSEYMVSCKTEILNTLTGTAEPEIKYDFYVPYETYETVNSYTFTFTKYLGDYATTDAIQAYIRPDNGLVVLEFSAHNFDNAEPVEPDLELIHASVYQFVTDSFSSSEYSYLMHSTQNQRFGYINGHLSMICTVKIALLSLDDNHFEDTNAYQSVAILLN